MAESFDAFTTLDPELLIATFTGDGASAHRDRVWESVFGTGEDPWARMTAEDRALARQCITDALRGSLVTHQLFQVQSLDRDEPLPVLLNFIPVSLPSGEGALKVTAVTVTGEVLAEPTSWTTSQTQRHRMENLGRMTMGIAHDFNNLLSGILGHTELIKSTLPSGSIPLELEENLRTIEQAAQDGAALVRKIQQYIRQEKQNRYDVLDVNTVIGDCIAFTKPYWYNEPRRQGIAIDTRLDLADVPEMHGSATELREVFVNLILNAVQAMPEGGEIIFQTRRGAGGDIVVTVQDTGAGMPESVRRRIFEPLFTTKGESGTGMGLAVTYGIIQEHDGSIAVRSQVGTGTIFTITLPPADAVPRPTASVAEEQEGRKAHILVVDDEPMVRTVVNKLLTLNGHDVVLADSAAAALALIERETFDVVFTDNGMPEMNGRQLARAIRERIPDLPIVLLTGDTEPGDTDENVNAVVGKPFKLEQLETTIQRLIELKTSAF